MGNVQGHLAGPDWSEESDVEEVSGASNPPTGSANHESEKDVPANTPEKVGGQKRTPNECKGGHWAWRCLAGVGRMFLGTGDGGASVKPVKHESGNSFGAVNREERRKKLAEAASKRVQNQTNRGIKNSSSVQFPQKPKKEIEKGEKQAAQVGCGDDLGVKPIKQENGNSSGTAKVEVEGQSASAPTPKIGITRNDSLPSGGNSDEKVTENGAQIKVASSVAPPNPEERRKLLAEATAKRVQNQANRGIKNSSQVRFQQQPKKEIEKGEEQAARMGFGHDAGVKPEEHESGNSSGAAKMEIEDQNGSTPPQKMEITNASLPGGNGDDEKMTDSDAQVEVVSSVSRPSQEDRRKKLAEAAAKRLQSQTNRGIKNSSSVQFRQQRKEEIEKREEQAARMGGGNDGKPTLRWQM